MKKYILLILICLSITEILEAQKIVSSSCEVGNFIWSARSVPAVEPVSIWVENLETGRIDTMTISYADRGDEIQCFATDNTVLFFLKDYNPTIFHFKLIEGKWQRSKPVHLPEVFPLVGYVKEGKEYERYRYELNAKGDITARLDIMASNEKLQKLEVKESYNVLFHLNFEKGAYEMEKVRIE